ncbi:Sec-independent protein translocase protein TatB [Luteimonas suaedae]|uniref:Sec-independent protein translocase protein TatB n=1 Tax=Luteimonas suaedae TaxID=2605430 RepID=UPI0011EF56A6|nr:Sec-independent protein translocase protein TatB [Luteimonas suaedae]
MFDIGFSEIFFIAIVALVVLGPERLPKAARFVGLWVRRGRAQWYSVKSELENELAAEELKRSLHEAEGAMREVDSSMRGVGDDVKREVDAVRDSVRETAREVEAEFADRDAIDAADADADADADETLFYDDGGRVAGEDDEDLDAPRARPDTPDDDDDVQRR